MPAGCKVPKRSAITCFARRDCDTISELCAKHHEIVQQKLMRLGIDYFAKMDYNLRVFTWSSIVLARESKSVHEVLFRFLEIAQGLA